jgi:transposase
VGRRTRTSPDVRERAVRLVMETKGQAPLAMGGDLRGSPRRSAAHRRPLRKWVRQAEIDSGRRGGLTTAERERIKELERENRELRRANEILRKAAAFFAKAELERRRG